MGGRVQGSGDEFRVEKDPDADPPAPPPAYPICRFHPGSVADVEIQLGYIRLALARLQGKMDGMAFVVFFLLGVLVAESLPPWSQIVSLWQRLFP